MENTSFQNMESKYSQSTIDAARNLLGGQKLGDHDPAQLKDLLHDKNALADIAAGELKAGKSILLDGSYNGQSYKVDNYALIQRLDAMASLVINDDGTARLPSSSPPRDIADTPKPPSTADKISDLKDKIQKLEDSEKILNSKKDDLIDGMGDAQIDLAKLKDSPGFPQESKDNLQKIIDTHGTVISASDLMDPAFLKNVGLDEFDQEYFADNIKVFLDISDASKLGRILNVLAPGQDHIVQGVARDLLDINKQLSQNNTDRLDLVRQLTDLQKGYSPKKLGEDADLNFVEQSIKPSVIPEEEKLYTQGVNGGAVTFALQDTKSTEPLKVDLSTSNQLGGIFATAAPPADLPLIDAKTGLIPAEPQTINIATLVDTGLQKTEARNDEQWKIPGLAS